MSARRCFLSLLTVTSAVTGLSTAPSAHDRLFLALPYYVVGLVYFPARLLSALLIPTVWQCGGGFRGRLEQ